MRVVEKGVYSKKYDLQNCKTYEEFVKLFHEKLDECDKAIETFEGIFSRLQLDMKYVTIFEDAVCFVRSRLQFHSSNKDGRFEMELMSDYVDLAFSFLMTYVFDEYKRSQKNATIPDLNNKVELVIYSADQILYSLDQQIISGSDAENVEDYKRFRDEIAAGLSKFEAVLAKTNDKKEIDKARDEFEQLLMAVSLDIIAIKEPSLLNKALENNPDYLEFDDLDRVRPKKEDLN